MPPLRFNPASIDNVLRRGGCTVAHLARQLGVHPQAVYAWRNGETTPSAASLLSMAALYGMSLSDFAKPGTEQ